MAHSAQNTTDEWRFLRDCWLLTCHFDKLNNWSYQELREQSIGLVITTGVNMGLQTIMSDFTYLL